MLFYYLFEISSVIQLVIFQNTDSENFAGLSQSVRPTPEQMEKLRRELDVVNGNLKVVCTKTLCILRFEKFKMLKIKDFYKFCKIQMDLQSSCAKFLCSVGVYAYLFWRYIETRFEWFYFLQAREKVCAEYFVYLFQVMRELLSEMVPGEEAPDDLQLLDELHIVVKHMHVRIQDLICSVQNDQIMCKFHLYK